MVQEIIGGYNKVENNICATHFCKQASSTTRINTKQQKQFFIQKFKVKMVVLWERRWVYTQVVNCLVSYLLRSAESETWIEVKNMTCGQLHTLYFCRYVIIRLILHKIQIETY